MCIKMCSFLMHCMSFGRLLEAFSTLSFMVIPASGPDKWVGQARLLCARAVFMLRNEDGKAIPVIGQLLKSDQMFITLMFANLKIAYKFYLV